ncbi:MAG: ABC transporter ATP-binding protein [Planctomycetota bacterium]|nr:ABC transporter ATP-binding protein [Planctomycetota bacterium]MDA1114333.1 ABC transporter ATP-binding protein [Planctomycetota bacterium]
MITLGAIAAMGGRVTLLFFKPLTDRLGLGEASNQDASASMLEEFTSNTMEPWLATFSDWGMPEGVSQVVVMLLLMCSIALVISIVQFFFLRLARMLSVRMVTDLRIELADYVMKLGMGFHSDRRLGDIISRLTVDVAASLRVISVMLEEIVQAPVAILASLFVAWAAEPTATMGMLILIPIIALPIAKIGPRIRRRAKKSQDSLGDTTQRLTQMLSGIRVVKAFRMEQQEIANFRQANDEFVHETGRMIRAQATSLAVTAFFANGGIGLVLGLLVILHLSLIASGQGAIFSGAGTMVVFLTSIGMLMAYVKRLTRAFAAIYGALGSIDRVFEVFELKAEAEDQPGAQAFTGLKQGIRFDQVGFTYPDAAQGALTGIQLEVARGERIALVGLSGAGKSTILDLVARFYEATEGKILVDGIDLRDLRKSDWMDHLAVVQQQPFLFQASIRDNICYGSLDASEEDILAACKAAHLSETLQQLPDGLDTQVGDSGARLSGGQAQRVTIARALLKDADVLLLDEATSALDSESERKVQDALENLMEGRTTFVIAHRLGTIRSADKILVLDSGRIIESGTHDALIAAGGSYATMWALQVGGLESEA